MVEAQLDDVAIEGVVLLLVFRIVFLPSKHVYGLAPVLK